MKTEINGRTLRIEIDLDASGETTSNGNILVASTHGWASIEKDVSLSLNLVRKVKK